MISRPTPTPTTPSTDSSTEQADRGPLSREEIARLVASDIPDGAYVNLGIGRPTKVADYLPPGRGSSCTPRTACLAWDQRRTATTSIPT
jgi:hypothetical protein